MTTRSSKTIRVLNLVASVAVIVILLVVGAKMLDRIDKQGDTIDQLVKAQSERRPVTEFFVCWVGRLGDYFDGATAPNTVDLTPAQRQELARRLAGPLITADMPVSEGGCVTPVVAKVDAGS